VKLTLIWLLFLFNKHNRDYFQIWTHSEISRFAIYSEGCPRQWRVACTKASGKSDCDPTFEASCFSLEHHLWTWGDLNDLLRDLNLSEKQAELLGSRLKGWNLLQKMLRYVSFSITKMNSNKFSLKKTNWYFAMLFARYIRSWTPTRSNCVHGTRYTQQPETHVATTLQNFNDVFYW
jgi:hypothetical protein